jgi:hypothetical protein
MREVNNFFVQLYLILEKALVSSFRGVQVAPTSLWYEQYKHAEKYWALRNDTDGWKPNY